MIDSISLQNFTGFTENQFHFTKGINVFIGKNGTGKTHIMKCLAASLQAYQDLWLRTSSAKNQLGLILAENLMLYFKPDSIGNLVHKSITPERACIAVNINGRELIYSFSTTSRTTVKIEKDGKWADMKFIYIPPREMFSLFEGFIGLTQRREISFDQTYINLAQALSVPALRDMENNPLKAAIELLEEELQFDVVQMNGRFYIKTEDETMEAHLVAEGLRKLASILYLILNGEINNNTILFWDEPEANLNPALIKVVAKFIKELEKCGLQLFIATHDYLLTHTLSLFSEYSTRTGTDVKFFSLRKEGKKTIVEEDKVLAGIQANPILKEYADYYDLEQQFISQYE